MYNNQYQNQMNSNVPLQPNLGLVKGYFRRKAVFAAGIALIAAAVMNVVTAVFTQRQLFALMQSVIPTFGDKAFSQAAQSASNNYFSAFIGLVIFALLICATFLIYFKSRNPLPTANPRAGFSILRVLSIIAIVFLCIICTLLILACLFMMMYLSAGGGQLSQFQGLAISPQYPLMVVGLWILLFVVLFIFALSLTWLISFMKFVGSARTTISRPVIVHRGAKAFGVVSMIVGVIYSLSALGNLGDLILGNSKIGNFQLNGLDNLAEISNTEIIISLGSTAVYAVLFILLAVIGLGYNKYIKNTVLLAQSSTTNGPTFGAFPGNPAPTAGNPNPTGGTPVAPVNPYQQKPQVNPYVKNTSDGEQSFQFSSIPVEKEPTIKEDISTPETPINTESPIMSEEKTAETHQSSGICPTCRYSVLENDVFCQHCGQKLK